MAPRHHGLVRFAALLLIAVSITFMAHRSSRRTDVTSEGLSRLTPNTLELIESVKDETPVQVHAFISDEVPRGYVTVRSRLLNILREMEARNGGGLRIRIISPKEYSVEADEAIERYGIGPVPVEDRSKGRSEVRSIFLGMALVAGPREEVVPFFSPGLSVEYEVNRALRVVLQEKKKVVGVLRTDVPIMGDFDIQSRQQTPAWAIVEELKKQYEVRSLSAATDIPTDVDVLIIPQLPSLAQEELDKVKTYVDAGKPAMITVDPYPAFNIRMSPREDKPPPPGQGGGGMFGQQQPSAPKGDYRGFLESIGVDWADDQIVNDSKNPHPNLPGVPPEVVFVTERPDGTKPFENVDPAVDGFEEVVVIYGGTLQKDDEFDGTFTPLLLTGLKSGITMWHDMVSKHPFFGTSPRRGGPARRSTEGSCVLDPEAKLVPGQEPPECGRNLEEAQCEVLEDCLWVATPERQRVLAARVTGGAKDERKDLNVVVIADLDLFGNQFFALRQRGGDLDGDGLVDVRFDNVSYLLNLIDSLAGDERFIELRKRKPAFRRLTKIDEDTERSKENAEAERQKAETAVEAELEKAQKALDAKVEAIRAGTDDDQTKAMKIRQAQITEQRRLQAKEQELNRDKDKSVDRIQRQHRRNVDEVQNQYRLIAILVPPLPALILGLFIFARKRRREQDAIPEARKRQS